LSLHFDYSSDMAFPLDLQAKKYSYIERPNTVLIDFAERHGLRSNPGTSVLDVGCGAGANARVLREKYPAAHLVGIEPSPQAAALAEEVSKVFVGTTTDWLKTKPTQQFDLVLMSDVLEHIADPVAFMRELSSYEGVAHATWIISVPNYAVWYNRVKTLAGSFEYAWSGLYDRTHLRFFTRKSVQNLLSEVGFQVVEDSATPSLVQSMAPVLRQFFEKDVDQGDHLSLGRSKAFQAYDRVVEPVERRVCRLWPELLGFQIVTVARLK
jgi:SAM-dependent methyltransferase